MCIELSNFKYHITTIQINTKYHIGRNEIYNDDDDNDDYDVALDMLTTFDLLEKTGVLSNIIIK